MARRRRRDVIDCCDFTVLDNHLHLILRNRPDIVAGWSDEEVARRWLRLKQSGGTSSDIPPVFERLGVTASQWEHAVTVTSRRFARELAGRRESSLATWYAQVATIAHRATACRLLPGRMPPSLPTRCSCELVRIRSK